MKLAMSEHDLPKAIVCQEISLAHLMLGNIWTLNFWIELNLFQQLQQHQYSIVHRFVKKKKKKKNGTL